MRKLMLLAALALFLGTATAQTISTEANWDGVSGRGPFGNWASGTATYGQTITLGDDPNHFLDYFTFHMQTGDNPFSFQGYVMSWSGNHADGGVLYSSSVVNYVPDSSYQTISFNTGHLDLSPNHQYVLFVSVSEHYDPAGGGGVFVGYVPFDPATDYTGGDFVFLNNFGDTSQWTNTDWTIPGMDDLAFDTNLPNPTPEPASLILLGSGLLGIGGTLRKRFLN